jgi:hypothetical protein
VDVDTLHRRAARGHSEVAVAVPRTVAMPLDAVPGTQRRWK